MSRHHFIATIALLVLPLAVQLNAQQMPLPMDSAAGQTVTPVFEGWYINPDGSRSIVFGYYNRNHEEVLDIPVGPDNFMSPGSKDQGQPTHFQTRRHWGVFTVTVPEDFGSGRIVWTLKMRGATFAIPGSLKRDWQIDALAGEAGSGNTPPRIRFTRNGPEGAGPAGIIADKTTKTSVGKPVSIGIFATDDGKYSGTTYASGEAGQPVNLIWTKHQGPGDVNFSANNQDIPYVGGEATTMATFSAAGDYILRVRASDASGIDKAGHAQCCWTNGFVNVTVRK